MITPDNFELVLKYLGFYKVGESLYTKEYIIFNISLQTDII